MPCTLTGSREGDLRFYLEESNKKVTEIADMLCKTCKILEDNEIKMPTKIAAWWKKHKEIDKKRRG
jgi:hypothetical protein